MDACTHWPKLTGTAAPVAPVLIRALICCASPTPVTKTKIAIRSLRRSRHIKTLIFSLSFENEGSFVICVAGKEQGVVNMC